MINMLRGLAAAASVAALTPAAFAQDDQTLLLRMPAVSGDDIVFVYAGDIWRAGLDGIRN